MTNKEKILSYLSKVGWIRGYLVTTEIFGASPATVDRMLRKMREDGIIESRIAGKFVEYQLIETQNKLFEIPVDTRRFPRRSI